MRYDIDGTGEREVFCSPYTLMVYEQEFKTSMVADVYGTIDLTRAGTETVTAEFVASRMREATGGELSDEVMSAIAAAFPAVVVTRLDYTADRWDAYLRAYWAMLKTVDERDGENRTPAFRKWMKSLGDIDLRGVSNVVYSCMEDGVFHPRASR